MKRNEIYEMISCLLLIMMVAILYSYQNVSILSILTLISGIVIFCIITYFSTKDEHKIDYELIKCECMCFCLLMIISLSWNVNLSLLMILMMFLLLFTTYREIKQI